MEPSDQQNPADKILAEFANITGTAVMVLNAEIDAQCFQGVRESLQKLGRQETLSLILNSGGGSIEYAFWIVTAIRGQCDHLDVIVLDHAKSAATLIALAADRILFGQFGELGPLDPQVPDTTGGAGRRSPLEIVKALEFLRTYYLETFDVIIPLLLRRTDMDVAHALEHAIRLLSPIAEPLYHSVNYRELGEAVRHLAVSEDYAKTTMHRWGPINKGSIDDIVRQLVWEYPEHGYIIDMEEARRIGLSNVENTDIALEGLYWSSIRELGETVNAGLFQDDDTANDETVTSVTQEGGNGSENEILCE